MREVGLREACAVGQEALFVFVNVREGSGNLLHGAVRLAGLRLDLTHLRRAEHDQRDTVGAKRSGLHNGGAAQVDCNATEQNRSAEITGT